MLLNNQPRVSSALLASLGRPEFCDIKIEVSGGELAANKTVLSMTCEFFRQLFNLLESSTGLIKLPYPKAVVEKVIIYLYSGEMDCDDLGLGSLLDLLEFLEVTKLTEELKQVETFTAEKIEARKFCCLECLNNLNKCSLIRLESIEDTLMDYLGIHLKGLCEREEVGLLSQAMLIRLIREKTNSSCLTIFRFKTFLTWLTANSMEAERKREVVEMFDFTHFSVGDLASDVRKSSLYPTDKIIRRMEKLFEEKEESLMWKEYEFEDLEEELEERGEEMEELETELEEMSGNLMILEEKETEIEELKKMLKSDNMELAGKHDEILQLNMRKMWLQEFWKNR